jgi:hypothetical protein
VKCAMSKCDHSAHARGLCTKHYQAAKKTNSLPPKTTLGDRLKRCSALNSGTGCVEWTGYKNQCGYGRLRHGKGLVYAHRLAWEIANGPILNEDLRVLHRCDNPACIHPAHLFLGTQADNMADMVFKGRQNRPMGERNGYSKLTENIVKRIRADSRTLKEIAGEYGVTYNAVSKVKLRKTWSHVA